MSVNNTPGMIARLPKPSLWRAANSDGAREKILNKNELVDYNLENDLPHEQKQGNVRVRVLLRQYYSPTWT